MHPFMKICKPETFFSLLCLSLGLTWIFFSSWMLSQFGLSPSHPNQIDYYTDAGFVVIVSLIIFIGIRFYRTRLSHSEFHYKTLFNTSPLPMWIFDIATGRFLLVNKAMIDKYGYSKKELLNMSPVDIRPSEEVERFLADMALKKRGIQDVGIWTHKKKNGELFTVQVRTNILNYRGKECYLVIADDISDLVKKETEIERLSLVAKHTVNGIIITGKDRTIEWVNDAFIKMTGYSFNEVAGKSPIELLHGEETDKEAEKQMNHIIASNENYSGEILNYRKDGSKMWVQTTVSPIEINGKTEKHVAIFIDITDRKQHEAMIWQQNERLKDIAFASSHLIRAPLANILGLTDLLNEEIQPDHEIIAHLKSSAKKLDDVVRDLVIQTTNSIQKQ